MKVDGAILTTDLAQVGEAAQQLERLGYAGAFSFDGPGDPFSPLLLAATHTERIELLTAVAIAFARNPMLVAQTAHDLQRLSRGRFLLGLGSQIRPHVERRFSMPWSRPVERMREFVLAVRAIWDAWETGDKLAFRGEFYRHTLMTPFFNKGPQPDGAPPILLAGVGPRMTAVAGEVADGFLLHPLNTPRFVDEVTRPALARGRQLAARSPSAPFQMGCQVLVASGPDAESRAAARAAVRAQIAFYASTPAYRVVLECEGWEGLQPELHRLSKRGDWAEMTARVPDAVLETVAVCGEIGRASCRERV